MVVLTVPALSVDNGAVYLTMLMFLGPHTIAEWDGAWHLVLALEVQ
jgi:hypothetical protein